MSGYDGGKEANGGLVRLPIGHFVDLSRLLLKHSKLAKLNLHANQNNPAMDESDTEKVNVKMT